MKETLKPEFSVEINSHEAHIIIRTDNREKAERLVKQIYPDAKFTRQGQTEFVLTNSYDRGENPVGTISSYEVPSAWLTNRRLEDEIAA